MTFYHMTRIYFNSFVPEIYILIELQEWVQNIIQNTHAIKQIWKHYTLKHYMQDPCTFQTIPPGTLRYKIIYLSANTSMQPVNFHTIFHAL